MLKSLQSGSGASASGGVNQFMGSAEVNLNNSEPPKKDPIKELINYFN